MWRLINHFPFRHFYPGLTPPSDLTCRNIVRQRATLRMRRFFIRSVLLLGDCGGLPRRLSLFSAASRGRFGIHVLGEDTRGYVHLLSE